MEDALDESPIGFALASGTIRRGRVTFFEHTVSFIQLF
jgi:hypothetical protein